MDAVFINHTNHCSEYWSEEERHAAAALGRIVDMAFPDILPSASEAEIEQLAEAMAQQIAAQEPAAVLCQGEYTYTYALVTKLLARGICVMAACSERVVEERREPDGSTRRISQFRFTQFRRYG